MTIFIDLQRRFRDLKATELENPEILASLNESKFGTSVDWPDLLKSSRVLLLAEAGAGKTIEMMEQARRLIEDGQFAFFVALESLDREPLVDILSAADERLFGAWKANSQAPAWFFLDAVDELKLTEGKLDRALLRLSKALDGYLDRARVIISCRPNDWRPSIDMATVRDRLPVPRGGDQVLAPLPSEEVFAEALRRDRGEPSSPTHDNEKRQCSDVVRTVVLLPMSDRQIRLFAEQSGVQDAAAFLVEIDRQNAWIFARRPLDLTELIATWTTSGRLGTRAQQHEANVSAKLKDSPDRADRGVLTDTEARLGAERLALALALTRTRTLRSPDQALDIQRAEGVLEPADILEDWSEQMRQALLRRALFDPATYGRVRFHHRSVQEYLAAQRLKALREKGMPTKALFRLLFCVCYGVEVVFPSMRAVAAWLALWDDAIRRELIRREPEALLSLGDPETLSLSARGELIRAFVNAYGKGSWRGLDIPLDEIRRLSHPELAPIIRELWGSGPANEDVRELLIEIISQGPIKSCVNLARTAAFDISWSANHRVGAVRALVACDRHDILREIAEAMIAQPDAWPDSIVYGVAADLFPKIIGVPELLTLMERTRESKRTVAGFRWVARQLAGNAEPWSEQALSLRDGIAELISRGRTPTQEFYCIKGKFDYLTPALAILCDRQLSTLSRGLDPALMRACVIASRFGEDNDTLREPVGKLKIHFQDDATLRSAVFWTELAFMDEILPEKDVWNRLHHTDHRSLLGQLIATDQPWLEAALSDAGHPERRAVALAALIQLWRQRGRVASEVEVLRAAIEGEATLEAIVAKETTPSEPNPAIEKMKQDARRRELVQVGREAQRLQNWKKWRDELIKDPINAFSKSKSLTTIANIHSWLDAFYRERSRYDVWNKDAIIQAFGVDIADRTEAALRVHWRSTMPVLWSRRSAEDRNSTPYVWIYGLCGVSAESLIPEWAASLSPDEASVAALYATLELNGFAPFLTDLAKSHPTIVDTVIGEELTDELGSGSDHDHLPILQDLSHADGVLKQLMVPRLLAALSTWPHSFSVESGSRWAHHLDQVLGILRKAGSPTSPQVVACECSSRYLADPSGPLALIWLRGLFLFDAQKGTQVLIEALKKVSGNNEFVIKTFAALFGDRSNVVLEIDNPTERSYALTQLVRIAYAFIRREDDQVHDGSYSPDTRDEAETARNFLLSSLLDTPGPEARRAILQLASEPDFAHFPDRLRLLARQRTAADAEFTPFDPKALLNLESRYEAPAHDRDSLFTVMMDRLGDLAHDVAHHDFTDRRTIRTISDEMEMQRTLSWRISANANGAFVVTREDEVADQKRTDIRFSAVKGNQKAVAEVKIADGRWSLAELEWALKNQLVGQYLRHATCRAGCLLLTYDGIKKYWINTRTNERMNFSDVITYLNKRAREIEVENMNDIRLAVFGLDLTDPQLAPAQR